MSDMTQWTGWRQHGNRLAAILVALAMTGIGCAHVHHIQTPSTHARVHKAGPPPHAPAHGYRHKHNDNVELVFDNNLGVYVVVGYPDHYHDGKRYYRWARGQWQMSARLDGVWLTVSTREVPTSLHGTTHKNKPKRGRGRGQGAPAKHGY